MHRVYRIFFIILGLSCIQLYSQECYIKVDGLSESALEKNRVKEIKIYQGKENNRKLLHEYTLNKSGCTEKHTYYDYYADSLGPVTETFERSGDGKIETYRSGRKYLNNKYNMTHTVRKYFTSTQKLWRKTSLEVLDLINYTIENIDTNNAEKIDRTEYTLLEKSTDTLRINKTFYDLKIKETILREKKDGNWKELERSITNFDSLGNYMDYKLFMNGKLHTQYSRNELERKEKKEKRDEENNNPLPLAVSAVDTFYTDDSILKFPLDKKVRSGKYKVFVLYYPPGKSKLQSYELYDSQSGLLLHKLWLPAKGDYFSSGYEAYEYTFWPE